MGIIKNFTSNGVPKGNIFEYPQGEKPLITKEIPTKLTDEPDNAKGLDFQATRRASDLARITKLLTTTTQGIKFSANQTLLRQEADIFKKKGDKNNLIKDNFKELTKKPPTTTPNPFTQKFGTLDLRNEQERKKTLGDTLRNLKFKAQDAIKNTFTKENLTQLKNNLIDGAVDAASVVGTTLAQVPVNGTGTHFIQGQEPLGKNIGYIPGKPHINALNGTPIGTTVGLANEIDEYKPPISYADTVGDRTQGNTNSIYTPYYKSSQELRSLFLNDASGVDSDRGIAKEKKVNIESRIGLNNPGQRNELNGKRVTADLVNLLPVSDSLQGNGDGRDLIEFRIDILTPEKTKFIYFRAFLNNFSDSHTAAWDSFNYIGRGDEMHTYQGFSRNVNCSWTIAAQSAYEMKPLYQKVNYLASAVAPTYNNNFMRGTLARLTIGDYLESKTGFIESVEYSWEDGLPFEIAMNEPENAARDVKHLELPMVLNASMNFRPIENFVPTTGEKNPYVATRNYLTSPNITGTNIG